ncbi:MAG: hypothetical protein Q8N53_18790, partial [Longimicrobiales bacterium]|nr:hypothetical protein [Longimicrobiales bacterium]
MQGLCIFGGQVFAGFKIFERFAQESRRTNRTVINLIADDRRDHFYNRFNEWTRRIILSAISACVAHIFY